METFRLIDELWYAHTREPQPGTSAAQGADTEAKPPFFAQMEQVLGAEAEPDSEFFIDSWTIGIAAASEKFLLRHKAQKRREQVMPACQSFFTFPPLFVAWVEEPAEAARRLREARTAERSTPEPGERNENDRRDAEEADRAGSLTIESARRVLGVEATSTQAQIRAAYRRMASRYHPDRLAQGETREQKLACERMASINEAYRLLRKGWSAEDGGQ